MASATTSTVHCFKCGEQLYKVIVGNIVDHVHYNGAHTCTTVWATKHQPKTDARFEVAA